VDVYDPTQHKKPYSVQAARKQRLRSDLLCQLDFLGFECMIYQKMGVMMDVIITYPIVVM